MKTFWNGLTVILGLLLAFTAIISATPRDTLITNTASYLPAWLPVALSSRWTLFVATSVMFTYAGYQLNQWLRRNDKRVGYEQGFGEGQAKGLVDGKARALLDTSQPTAIQKLVDNAKPARERAAESKASVNQLIYSVKEVMGALTAPGMLDERTVGLNMAKIKSEQPIWHIDTNYRLRKSFIEVVDKAQVARMGSGNARYIVTTDYKPEDRDHHVKSIQNCGDRLIEYLSNPVLQAFGSATT